MKPEHFRRFHQLVDFYVFFLTQKLAWVRNELATSDRRSASIDQQIDELLLRLDRLELAMAQARATFDPLDQIGSSAIDAAADLRASLGRLRPAGRDDSADG